MTCSRQYKPLAGPRLEHLKVIHSQSPTWVGASRLLLSNTHSNLINTKGLICTRHHSKDWEYRAEREVSALIEVVVEWERQTVNKCWEHWLCWIGIRSKSADRDQATGRQVGAGQPHWWGDWDYIPHEERREGALQKIGDPEITWGPCRYLCFRQWVFPSIIMYSFTEWQGLCLWKREARVVVLK